MRSTPEECVAAGVAWLNSHKRGWRKQIETTEQILRANHILIQLYGNFTLGQYKVAESGAGLTRLGFAAPWYLSKSARTEWGLYLEELWTKELNEN